MPQSYLAIPIAAHEHPELVRKHEADGWTMISCIADFTISPPPRVYVFSRGSDKDPTQKVTLRPDGTEK